MTSYSDWVNTLSFEDRLMLLAECGVWAGDKKYQSYAQRLLNEWRTQDCPPVPGFLMRELWKDLCTVARDLQPGIVRIIGRKLLLPGA